VDVAAATSPTARVSTLSFGAVRVLAHIVSILLFPFFLLLSFAFTAALLHLTVRIRAPTRTT
jgi:hypothetical protein